MHAFVPAYPPLFASRSRLTTCSARRSRPSRSPRMALAQSPPGLELVRPPPETVSPTGPLTAEDIEAFYRDGFVIARGLLTKSELSAIHEHIPALDVTRPETVSRYANLSFRVWNQCPFFLDVATSSAVAAAAAQLTPSSGGDRGLVVLNDAFFRMKGNNIGCGFHVDDSFFWPSPLDAPGPGVNAWIALDDVGEDGGGLAIAPGSFQESFLECRRAIREGGTCLLAELDSELNDSLEKIAIKPRMRAGDVILHTRFLFHRGDPFVEGSVGERGPGVARYSIRYMPGEAVVEEVRFVDGKVVREEPVQLRDADKERFPAVCL